MKQILPGDFSLNTSFLSESIILMNVKEAIWKAQNSSQL